LGGVEREVACLLMKFDSVLDRGEKTPYHLLVVIVRHIEWHRYTHEDTEVIAATVAGMPDSLGRKRMAIRVAELARAGLTPDWMPGAVSRCVPVEVKRNQHGERASTVVVGTDRVLSRGKWRTVAVLACPVTFSPHPEQIAAARRAYGE
jgi:hypothetical protein